MSIAYQTSTDGTPTNGANPWIDSLVWGGRWADADGGTVTIGYSAAAGYNSGLFGGRSMAWDAADTRALNRALASWEAVANVDFVSTSAANADAQFWKLTNAQTRNATGSSTVLGFSEVPLASGSGPLDFAVNGQHSTWRGASLNPGGYGFVTLIHELGHLLGLAHPHDGGMAADATVFPGVTGPFDSYGLYDLNQGIFTTMSYNDGWETGYPTHHNNAYGWQATPMALDIAAIQAIYGANTTHASGDNIYSMTSGNGGAAWRCIWDTGGIDKIQFNGSRVCTIDLRDAPLVGPDAGGYVSYAAGIVGGFTIANGVIIENAVGGKSRDFITGNGADNILAGRAGNDVINGFDGNDTINGGGGTDVIDGGNGDDVLVIGPGSDRIDGGAGIDTLVIGGRAHTRIDLNIAGVQKTGLGMQSFTGIENITGGRFRDRLTGDGHDNVLLGGGNNDVLFGNAGADTLGGGSGTDHLFGGLDTDQDTFVFTTTADSLSGTRRDVIHDFVSGIDLIDLSGIDANAATAGDDAFVFNGTAAAAGAVWYAQNGADLVVYMDVNGDGVADSEISVLQASGLSASDFLL
ncbi:MAG: M10 family metallopeptidase [Paracoccaceae bacterium]